MASPWVKRKKEMLEAAIEYHQRGFSVFPTGKDKRPLLDWKPFQERKANQEEIKGWWEKWPEANIAIATGKISNLCVIDIDSSEGLRNINEILPDSFLSPRVSTPSGGWHYYTRFTDGLRSNSQAVPGCDLRAEGGFIVAPPSVSEKGIAWEWRDNLDEMPLPDMPQSYLEYIKANQKEGAGAAEGDRFIKGRRNEDVFHIANVLAKDGLPKDITKDVVLGLAAKCTPLLPEKEALAATESAYRRHNEGDKPEGKTFQIETVADIIKRPKQEINWLIYPFVEKNSFTLLGGVKGIGKSLFVMNLALCYASGKSTFLTSEIKRPGKVLLIQQEVSEEGFQDRIQQIVAEENFKNTERFSVLTTTKNPLKLSKQKDFDVIWKIVSQVKPDVLILDPLSRFLSLEENRNETMSIIVDKVSMLKTEFEMAVILTHHFSSKRNPDDPTTPNELAGLFRGHTTLSDSADVLIGLTRLPRYQKQQALPLSYENYCMVEVECRHGKKPERFAIERGENSLIFQISYIWEEIGKKIIPKEIVDLVRASGEEMLRKDVITHYGPGVNYVSPKTIDRAIQEAKRAGLITIERLSGRGSPSVLKLAKSEEP